MLLFSSSSAQICYSTVVADILPLARLPGGFIYVTKGYVISLQRALVHPVFTSFPSLSAFRVSLLQQRGRGWAGLKHEAHACYVCSVKLCSICTGAHIGAHKLGAHIGAHKLGAHIGAHIHTGAHILLLMKAQRGRNV